MDELMRVVVQFLPAKQTGLRLVAVLMLVFPAAICPAVEPQNRSCEAWKLVSQSGNVVIYSRLRAKSPIREFKAVGRVDAPPSAVLAVIDDVDAYPDFMPFVTECRIVKREANSILTYQRIAPPFCTKRDYVIRIFHDTKPTPTGTSYGCRWYQADGFGPPEQEGTIRIRNTEGSWLFEPAPGNATSVTYSIYTDSGGSIPSWLAGTANQIAIGKLFAAVRKQVKETKYASAR